VRGFLLSARLVWRCSGYLLDDRPAKATLAEDCGVLAMERLGCRACFDILCRQPLQVEHHIWSACQAQAFAQGGGLGRVFG